MNLAIPTEPLSDLCRAYRVRELYLFGSAARGEMTPSSDIDILVEFERDAPIGLLELAALERRLSALLHRPVDLVPKSGLKPRLRPNVLRDARLLFAA